MLRPGSFVSGSVHVPAPAKPSVRLHQFFQPPHGPPSFCRATRVSQNNTPPRKTETERAPSKGGGIGFAGCRRGRGQAGWDPSRNDKSPTPDPARRGMLTLGPFRPPDTYREAALRFANNLSDLVGRGPAL
eukprot:3995701-Prymnesium_polylepis.1